MLNGITETFLSVYFSIRAVLGKYLTDDRKLFDVLSRICLVSEKETDKLYALAEDENVDRIATADDFKRYQRFLKYSDLRGADQSINSELGEIIEIKGGALNSVTDLNIISDSETTRNGVYDNLSTAAANGTVAAMRIMGILQCEGIFFDKNQKKGLKTLSKSAGWNDCLSILALLHYGNCDLKFNMARLRQVTENTPYSGLYYAACERYGNMGDDLFVGEIKLLNRAFRLRILHKETYESRYARILNSRVISFRDKEKALLIPKEQLSAISDLPLKLSFGTGEAFDESVLDGLTLKRTAEAEAIVRALKNSDLRGTPSYRPLCICSDSKYVLETYAKAIASKGKRINFERIGVAELSEYDLEPTPNNIFVRNVDEDKDNVFMLFFCGNISIGKLDTAKRMLQSDLRTKFHLHNPNITLDLSAVLPICFCDKRNSEYLKPYCDVIGIAPIGAEELSTVVKDIFIEKTQSYGIGDIRLCGDPCELFRGYDVDTIEKIIDSAVLAEREKGVDLTVTPELIKKYEEDSFRPRIGFGGFNDGSKC